MAAVAVANGGFDNHRNGTSTTSNKTRFSDVPPTIDIPLGGPDSEMVEVNLDDELVDPAELCQLLEDQGAAKPLWVTIALAYAKQGQIDHAQEILERGVSSLARSGPKDRLILLTCTAWLDLWKSRQAPRVVPEAQAGQDVKTKDYYLREATSHINDALRINPAFPPLLLIRGVLNLLKASLTTSTKTGSVADAERKELLGQALKCFDEALKVSDRRNMMAALGRARVLYLQANYKGALAMYQTVLSRMPNLTDPDPRIGIGCCYWQLNYHDHAKLAWERSLALQPESKVAHALLGVYYLRQARKHPADHPQFNALYTKAVKQHMQKAYALDKKFAFNDVNFADYFLLTNRYAQVEGLARTAIEQTDVNAIASDGWYLIARKEHSQGSYPKASDAYSKSDQARSVVGQGHWPAKFGMIQLSANGGNLNDARFRLEKLSEMAKSIEATTLLGCLYAEDVFAARRSQSKEDKSAESKKAAALLENARKAWKDPKSGRKPDESVLIYLAQLYEVDSPLESFKVLNELRNSQSDNQSVPVNGSKKEDGSAGKHEEEELNKLPPQLLNNIACFLYSYEEYERAVEYFQGALTAVVALNDKQEADKRAVEEGQLDADDLDLTDTDALVTSISYNLGRAYEARGSLEEAKDVYERLLNRHSDYTQASARLAIIALQQSPQDQGPRKIAAVYQSDYGNTEVRALMGWYYHSSKRKTANLAEDNENRHYKHTLQGYDKHDLYSLVGMGNIHLTIARDMPRGTDAEKEKRSKMYQKAYEFFDKALQLDPKNAYAAQGVAIALCDDKKQYSEALQILVKARDTIKDTSIHVNLAHVYAELRQYQRSIDNYELALRKDGDKGSSNAQLLVCLSRVLLLKGKADKSIYILQQSLDYMKRALERQPDSPHLQFNVAFIQFQIVQEVNQLPETGRTLEDVETAQQGLEEAIATFESVAKAKNPPYPRSALELRAAMSKNTMRKQIERAHQQQSTYEANNKEKLEQAKERRALEIKRREDAARSIREAEEAKSRKLAAEREEIIRKTDELAEKMRAEALAREALDYTDDEETGERVKRSTKKKARGGARGGKKRDRDDDGFIEDDEDDGRSERTVSRTPLSGSDDEGGADDGRKSREKSREPKKKKRKLERKSGGAAVKAAAAAAKPDKQGKFKSAAVVVESDSEEEPGLDTPPETPPGGADDDGDVDMDVQERRSTSRADVSASGAGTSSGAAPKRQRKQLRTIADDDEDEDEEEERVSSQVPTSRSAPRVVDDDDDE